MPTDKKAQGFAALPKHIHKQYSSKGGKARVPKGTSVLSPEARSQRARDAANAMWERRRRNAVEAAAINSAEDGRPNDDGEGEGAV